MRNYGEILKETRQAYNLTQKEIASQIGITQQAISNYENNINEPTIGICELLANYYGITIDELIGRETIPLTKHIISNTINNNHGTIKIKNG